VSLQIEKSEACELEEREARRLLPPCLGFSDSNPSPEFESSAESLECEWSGRRGIAGVEDPFSFGEEMMAV
jgi:hypothetical protein